MGRATSAGKMKQVATPEQQRRERGVVVGIDQLHSDRRTGQRADRSEPGRARPDDNNTWPAWPT